jgi:hypothetical protein
MSDRARLIKLYKKDCHCYWCGVETNDYYICQGKKLPDDAATIDHLYPKGDIRRLIYELNNLPQPVVLSCYKCNTERSGNPLEKQLEKCNKSMKLELHKKAKSTNFFQLQNLYLERTNI